MKTYIVDFWARQTKIRGQKVRIVVLTTFSGHNTIKVTPWRFFYMSITLVHVCGQKNHDFLPSLQKLYLQKTGCIY